MADFPVELTPDLTARLARALDIEGKIPRALEVLGPMGGADVVLVDGEMSGVRARQLTDLGARLTVVQDPPTFEGTAASGASLADLAAMSADAIVTCWSGFRADQPAELTAAQRVLRPAGRLLVIHDYGRDDVSRLRSPDLPEYTTWSHRDGWFLRSGFKLRVIHCWWTFGSVNEASAFLDEAFGAAGNALAAGLKRPRLSYNVAIYHHMCGPGVGAPVRQVATRGGGTARR